MVAGDSTELHLFEHGSGHKVLRELLLVRAERLGEVLCEQLRLLPRQAHLLQVPDLQHADMGNMTEAFGCKAHSDVIIMYPQLSAGSDLAWQLEKCICMTKTACFGMQG